MIAAKCAVPAAALPEEVEVRPRLERRARFRRGDEEGPVRGRASRPAGGSPLGCVVSRTWKRSRPNARRSTSGARLDPPIPSRTTSSAPPAASASSPSSPSRCRIRSGSSSHPSHWASSCPVQTVGSRSQIRSTSSPGSRRLAASLGDACSDDQLAALRADPVEQLGERVGELLHALLLEHPRDVVDVDPGRGQLVEEPPRLVESLLERQRDLAVVLERLDRLLGHRVHGVAGRSAPRRRGRPGTPGSSSRSTPRGTTASTRPSPRAPPSARRRRAPSSSRYASFAFATASLPFRSSWPPIASSRLSASVSTRETKKLATDATPARVAARLDEPLDPADVRLHHLAVALAARRSA